jgi:uncharacterized protein YbjT (DUF2867 family)
VQGKELLDKGAAMILVTGAAGNNGQAAVREISRQSVKVRALVRDASKATAISDLANVEVVQGDMQKPETLSGALDGVERALLISSATPAMYDTQCTFIDAARAAGVRHVVKFSGKESSIGFNPDNFSFTRMHAQVEHYLEASGLDWTHIRPSQFMQVYLREAPSIASKGVLSLAAGDIDLSPIDIPDIAKICFGVLTTDGNEGQAYEMTGPQALSMPDIAAIISDIVGKPVRYESVTPEQKREGQLAAGMPPALVDALYDQAIERLAHPRSRVFLEAHEEFGVEPTTFADFIQRHKQLFA